MKALAAVLTLLCGCQAAAQSCGDRDIITHKLRVMHHERFEGGGKQSVNFIYEIWRSADKGTWTILRTGKDGVSCIMAAGTNWIPRTRGVPG